MSDARLIPSDIDLTADKHLSNFRNSSEETDRFLFGKRAGIWLSDFVQWHLDVEYYDRIKPDINDGIYFNYIDDHNSFNSSFSLRAHTIQTSWIVTTQRRDGIQEHTHFMLTESDSGTSTTIDFSEVDDIFDSGWTSGVTNTMSTSVVFGSRVASKCSDKNQFGETESAFETHPGKPLDAFMRPTAYDEDNHHSVKFSDFIDDVYDDRDWNDYMRLDELVITPENILRSRESNIVYVNFRAADGDMIATRDTTIHNINEFVTGLNFVEANNDTMLAL